MPTAKVKQKFYTVAEVAAILRVKPITVQRWARLGKIRSTCLSNRPVLIPVEEIEKLAACTDGEA